MHLPRPSISLRSVSLRSVVGALIASVLVASLVVAPAPRALAAGTFDDDDTSVHESAIESIAEAGITEGCGGASYCPTQTVTRGQMASFLARALELPDSPSDYFSDDETNTHEGNINRIAHAGITGGFEDGTYRPDELVTRAQMASFLVRSIDRLTPNADDYFTDDDTSPHEANINGVAAGAVTLGCTSAGDRFCPNNPVRRDQMASFLARSLELVPVFPIDVVIYPGTDIQSVVDANPTGTTFLIAEGTHRMQTIEPKNDQSFIGQAGSVLNGAKVVSDWTQEGDLWMSSGHTEDGRPFGECETGTACRYPEDLFIDNTMLTQVLSLGEVVPGTFYFDNGANRLYMADDPTGHEVEFSSTNWAFNGDATGVTIYGLTVEMYANPAQEGAINGRDGKEELSDGWLVWANEVRWNHGHGIRLGDRMVVRDNHVHHNGQIGIGGQGTDVLIEGNEIAYNNTAGFRLDWEAGGTKFIETNGLVVRHNHSHHNQGSGFWSDIDNINTLYEYNTVTDNARSGIHHEISYDVVVRYNTLERNGFAKSNWFWGSGILIDISPNAEVYGNTVIGNANGITGIQQTRGNNQGAYGALRVENMHVYDNIIDMSDGGITGIGDDTGGTATWNSLNNRFENNTYVLQSAAVEHFGWDNDRLDWSRWLATGNGSGSTWSQ